MFQKSSRWSHVGSIHFLPVRGSRLIVSEAVGQAGEQLIHSLLFVSPGGLQRRFKASQELREELMIRSAVSH